jgi:hypothetical protein
MPGCTCSQWVWANLAILRQLSHWHQLSTGCMCRMRGHSPAALQWLCKSGAAFALLAVACKHLRDYCCRRGTGSARRPLSGWRRRRRLQGPSRSGCPAPCRRCTPQTCPSHVQPPTCGICNPLHSTLMWPLVHALAPSEPQLVPAAACDCERHGHVTLNPAHLPLLLTETVCNNGR